MNASLVIFEDLYGYLWLGSQSGVDRFDGYDFINYANVSSDSSSTNLKWVNAIAEDNNGNIWASDQFGNISNYLRSQDKWVNYYPIYKDSITNVPEGYQQAYDAEIGTVYVVSVSGPKMYPITKGNYAKRVAENTQLYQIIHVDDLELRYEAYEATGDLYDTFTLRKREGLPNLLVEALPPENRR